MTRYDLTLRILHWTMAVLIIGMFCSGLYADSLPKESTFKPTLMMLHKATGTLLLVLAFIRLGWSVRRVQALPSAIAGWQRSLAVATKHLLYLLILLVPLSGFVMSISAGRAINFYNLFEIPLLWGENRSLAGFAYQAHELLALLFIGVVCLHIAGAIKHRLSGNAEEDVLKRML